LALINAVVLQAIFLNY